LLTPFRSFSTSWDSSHPPSAIIGHRLPPALHPAAFILLQFTLHSPCISTRSAPRHAHTRHLPSQTATTTRFGSPLACSLKCVPQLCIVLLPPLSCMPRFSDVICICHRLHFCLDHHFPSSQSFIITLPHLVDVSKVSTLSTGDAWRVTCDV
jgi:hypothetical protein